MRQKARNSLENLKRNLLRIVESIKRPRYFVANCLYRMYKSDKDRIPYPLFHFISQQFGGYAGISIYLNMREYGYKVKISKLKRILLFIFVPIIVVSLLIVGALQDSTNFIFGFVQNLLADIILILLVLYILPKVLNKPKKYNICLRQDCSYSINDDNVQELLISSHNIGEEVYKIKEYYWEIYIPWNDFTEEDIIRVNGSFERDDELHPFYKFSGINDSPLFLNQEQFLLKIRLSEKVLEQEASHLMKIYYRFWTIVGNIPTFENITHDFMGYGYSVDRYPKLGEFVIVTCRIPPKID
jgi:hypothetical protein